MTVAFNNIHRRMLGLPWRCSASAMYANYDLPNIDTVKRSLNGFIQRLSVSLNTIMCAIEQSWFVRIKICDFWTKILCLQIFLGVFQIVLQITAYCIFEKYLLITDMYISMCVFYLLANLSMDLYDLK